MKKVILFFVAIAFCATSVLANTPGEPLKGGKCPSEKGSRGAGTAVKSDTHAKSANSGSRPNIGKKAFKMNPGYGAGHTIKGPVKKLVFRSSPSGAVKTKTRRLG
jgi:hypothetical protein